MPRQLQEFLARSTEKAVSDLVTALLRLPEDKRNWSPAEKSRTALDMVAEVALLNGVTASIMRNHIYPPDFDMADYQRGKAELCGDWVALQSLLEQNTAEAAATIRAVPDEDLGIQVEMPWGPMTLEQIISYPYWNMSYHEGQINYLASMLGCLA